MMTKPIVLLFFCLLFAPLLSAQAYAPKREMRGVWIASVTNIDFPKKPTTNAIAQKEQWRKLVERLHLLGINTLFVQVRPTADALYASELVPWSAYLTGKQGVPPSPIYDPLQYMVEVAHEFKMELHAWVNPYRATMNLDTLALSSRHVFNQHRDWCVQYGNKFYLNPGLPDVRRHIVEVVEELTSKYDIDGIHIDDYFYPYKIEDQIFPDSAAYAQYGEPYGSLSDWRRNNNDQLVEALHSAIKGKKPYMRFGISPFGVWRNKEDDPIGSDTKAGVRSYDDLYADVLNWLEKGWVDYVAPQLYFSIGFAPADYETLVNWWRQYTFEKMLIVGHGAYKVGDNPDEAWMNPNEIPRQIQLNRRYDDVYGSIFFSASSLLRNSLGIADSLAEYYKTPAISPLRMEIKRVPATPKLKRVKGKDEGILIKWKPNKLVPTEGFGMLPPDYYIIYRLPTGGRINEAANIVGITRRKKKVKKFIDKNAPYEGVFTYRVTAVNSYGNESGASNPISVRVRGRKTKKIK